MKIKFKNMNKKDNNKNNKQKQYNNCKIKTIMKNNNQFST